MNNQILLSAKSLGKRFISYKKQAGISGSIKSFFKRDPITKDAVFDFNLEIKKGEIVGLLGPNGAGKTTLMKMFTGIIVPSNGELKILGYNPWQRNKEFRKKIALVMGQKSQLWWDIPAMDSFLLLQKYYEISDEQFNERISSMSKLLGVEDQLNIHVRKLSLGERMKMELMASLLHNPELIFLDEPTIGLDLVAQENIRKFIKDYHAKNNCSIIITSHYMADVQALCHRLVLIFDGKKKFDGAIEQFEDILGVDKVVSFTFACELQNKQDLWQEYSPQWSQEDLLQNVKVELKIPEEKLREVSIQILENFPVTDFATDNIPIERVMKTLMTSPELLEQGL
jgi:ABC-2 type transport system ATP-binding protein